MAPMWTRSAGPRKRNLFTHAATIAATHRMLNRRCSDEDFNHLPSSTRHSAEHRPGRGAVFDATATGRHASHAAQFVTRPRRAAANSDGVGAIRAHVECAAHLVVD